MKALVKTLAELVFLIAVAPLLLPLELAALWLADLVAAVLPKKTPADTPVRSRAVSVVIPTWNAKHHLEANLPSVVKALEGNPDNEIVIVENGSEDGSADYVREHFPGVRVLALERNLGFGGGSNAGFRAAKNDIVVLLNNDMRVEPDFLAPLIEGFTDEKVFAVSAQIFFSDPAKRREETGLTTGVWERGRIRLGHKIDEDIDRLYPTFYAGGGSSAYDRRKFLEIGGFDALLRPFYLEDADVSYMAWKRGWKILYAPGSVVYHEHRGTIGKRFSPGYIDRVIQMNNLSFLWKNIHEPGRLVAHFFWTWLALAARIVSGPTPTRPDPLALLKAVGRTHEAMAARIRARRLAVVGDTEAIRRPLGGYFRDRFAPMASDPERLNVLFVSPYGMEPPIHGGGVFMNQTVRRLAGLTRLHLLCLVDSDDEVASNAALGEVCASAEILVRAHDSRPGKPLLPHAAQHFESEELEWRLHRSLYLNEIDVLQLEYTQLAVYACDFERIGTFLFEHDVYFQTVWRGMGGETSVVLRWKRFYEYLRALRFERRRLKRFDAIQVCTAVNRKYLESFAWDAPPIEDGFRAGIDVSRYAFHGEGREPDTVLFVGNFRHPPNQAALAWFVREAWPRVRAQRTGARLIAVGAQAPAEFRAAMERVTGVEFVGEVDDIRDALRRYAVFIAPILSGSGVRVKLLEAFAAGAPTVATRIGAEGLAEASGEIVELADTPEDFAAAVVRLLGDPAAALELARRARAEVEAKWDMAVITGRLAERYGAVVRGKRSSR